MIFYWTETMESTHTYLLDYIKKYDSIDTPFVVATKEQTGGIGSRGNTWQQVTCGLYFSCLLHKTLLPQDLPMQSASIYFGSIFLEIFRDFNPNLWLKWPNDFYIEDSKVGGLLTQNIRDYVIFGIGLNLISSQHKALFQTYPHYDSIAREWAKDYVTNRISLENYCNEWILYAIVYKILDFLSFNIVKFDFTNTIHYQDSQNMCKAFLHTNRTWYAVLGRYSQEFHKNHRFTTHIVEDGIEKRVSLKNAKLQHDGSILLHNTILYGLR